MFTAESTMASQAPRIIVEYQNDIAIISFTKDHILSEGDVKSIEESVLPLVRNGAHRKLLIDFSNVNFLSSAVLGTLIRILSTMKKYNGRLVLCSINDKVFEIFKITRLNQIFETYPDFAQAMKSFLA
jgi:anti-sigma B factor antagonist